METSLISRVGVVVLAAAAAAMGQAPNQFRAPAVPLVVHDPYFSVWSFSDKLTDSWPRHWTGKTMGMCGLARIDGKVYRWCGPEPRDVPAMEQVAVMVNPLTTAYAFKAGGVALTVNFCSPVMPGDAGLASTPITGISVTPGILDGANHEIEAYLDCSAEWCVNVPEQRVRWTRARVGGGDVVMFASQEQPVLEKKGDDLRIDWGSFVMRVTGPMGSVGVSPHGVSRGAFVAGGKLPADDDARQPRAASDDWPVLGGVWTPEKGKSLPSWGAMLGYDDGVSVELFGRRLRPLWRVKHEEFAAALMEAEATTVFDRAVRFDVGMRLALHEAGGAKYAQLAGLAFRQTMAAHKIAADWDGTPLMFPKENFSNGCISTVDVIFPSSPFFLALNPELLKAQLRPLMDYAASARWKFPFAPHDLGTYPLANGQVYGGGEKTEEDQMPVEESGNMVIMLAALAKVDGNPDFAAKWWPTVEKWAAYLKEHGLDPENQLCTDDFAGHLAHNTNLAIKAIVALGGYAQLCEMMGKKEAAAEYWEVARRYAGEWVKKADDGDHFRLAYDKPGTWSQKYNLVWDRVLETGLFPAAVAEKEMAFYRTKLNKYGLPLDNRAKYAKLDFSVWTACLTGKREDFDAIVNPMYDFANQTPDRVPLTDWYGTEDAKCVGFRARSVVGAVYMPLLLERLKQK